MILGFLFHVLLAVASTFAFKIAFRSKEELANVPPEEKENLISNLVIIASRPNLKLLDRPTLIGLQVLAQDLSLSVDFSETYIEEMITTLAQHEIEISDSQGLAANNSERELILGFLESMVSLFKTSLNYDSDMSFLLNMSSLRGFHSPDQLLVFGMALWDNIADPVDHKHHIMPWLLQFGKFARKNRLPCRDLFTDSNMSQLVSIYVDYTVDKLSLPAEMTLIAALLRLATISHSYSNDVLNGWNYENIASSYPQLPAFLATVTSEFRFINISSEFFEVVRKCGLASPSLFFENYVHGFQEHTFTEYESMKLAQEILKNRCHGRKISYFFEIMKDRPISDWEIVVGTNRIHSSWIKRLISEVFSTNDQPMKPDVRQTLKTYLLSSNEPDIIVEVICNSKVINVVPASRIFQIFHLLSFSQPKSLGRLFGAISTRTDHDVLYFAILKFVYAQKHIIEDRLRDFSIVTLIHIWSVSNYLGFSTLSIGIRSELALREDTVNPYEAVELLLFYLTKFPIDKMLSHVEKLANSPALRTISKYHVVYNTDPQNVLSNLLPSLVNQVVPDDAPKTPRYSFKLCYTLLKLFSPLIPNAWKAFIENYTGEFSIKALSNLFLCVRPYISAENFEPIYKVAFGRLAELADEKNLSYLASFLKVQTEDGSDLKSFISPLIDKLPYERWQVQMLLCGANTGVWQRRFLDSFAETPYPHVSRAQKYAWTQRTMALSQANRY